MFTYDVYTADLFTERARQFASWGIPRRTIADVRHRVRDMWGTDAGSWTFEWTRHAKRAETHGRDLLAAMLHGAAKFPVACTEIRQQALANQVQCYLKASETFPCRFQRSLVTVKHETGETPVAAHIFESPARSRSTRPLVLLSGGVDTCKVELHKVALALARIGGFRAAAIDMPGTGESEVCLAPDSERIYEGVILALGQGGPVGILGISFGGHWAAKLALKGSVSAAVDLGGPSIGFADLEADSVTSLPNGMSGILGNALGLSEPPDETEAELRVAEFSLRAQGLLDGRSKSPLLAINGSDDAYIPTEETRGFRDIENATALLVPGTTHCAAERIVPVMATSLCWLRYQLHGPTVMNRAALAAARAVLRAATD